MERSESTQYSKDPLLVKLCLGRDTLTSQAYITSWSISAEQVPVEGGNVIM